ncbi:MAG: prepilin-type N-terminal cleavage/methylation domain-containing protein [Aquificaceae bacterium]|nr:prepilin-type N-terminal cleavage/methylation domain-containing protein [Aquificaceae bacterium]MDW8422924.1 prepilin-type N-terminal cleavage/methylation domain-containing protein [Aquificaceae bacterium]
MCGSKGFTLLELIVAIAILSVGFSVVYQLLAKARADQSYAETLAKDLIQLNNLLVEGRTEGLEESRSTLRDYPEIEELSYKLGGAELVLYRLKR